MRLPTRLAAVTSAVLALLALGSGPAAGSTSPAETASRAAAAARAAALATVPQYAGPGWRIAKRLGVRSISPTQQYVVTFPSEELQARYTPYLTRAVTQLQQLGVRITLGGLETPDYAKCPPRGHIQYTEAYQPLGRAGYSQGLPCYNTIDHSAWGGWVRITSEYWDGSWYITEQGRFHVFVHEMLHALGLDHPNVDLNGDGTVADYECVKDSAGLTPLMCSPNGGYRDDTRAGLLTPFDVAGIRNALRNAPLTGAK
ncbi:hypothetical protein [Streptomyces sp. NPDC017529]|uniref:hypothetical protein n=1 Tax=Streptomyces sp. NPDC017529 TaxID=3365000 RepID=UPI0037992A57